MKSAPGLFSQRVLKLGAPALFSPRQRIIPSTPDRASAAEHVLPDSDATRLVVPVIIGGVPVDLMSFENAVAAIMTRAAKGGAAPLGVLSANLDHVHHFGAGGRWSRTLKSQRSLEWLTLLDGAPLVTAAGELTQRHWPRLAGSDLIGPILDRAASGRLRVGFLGGRREAHSLVQDRFNKERPDLRVAGWWAPTREELADPQKCRELCGEIARSEVDILVVCLGKPRQELWMARYGILTGAKVMLAFGAVVDFLAGRVPRAPERVRDLRMEWAWRLALEPRRLARRYVVEGPGAYIRVRKFSSADPVRTAVQPLASQSDPRLRGILTPGRFAPVSARTDVAVLVVTYKNAQDMGKLLQSLRRETADQSIKVIVADNSPTPETLDALSSSPDVLAFSTGGNMGYAGGLNQAMERAGEADCFLVLNPDLWIDAGSIRAMRDRMASSRAGVVVPILLDEDGSTYPSLRREPSVLRSVGDALWGSRIPSRPGWLSEMDFDPNSYLHPHPVDWATGAALLISADVVSAVGSWDEQFFLYSEEIDFCRRVRDLGSSVWFEPNARMTHQRGGSGASPDLSALMAVNRIRYARKYSGTSRSLLVHCTVAAGELVRVKARGNWRAFRTVVGLRRWEDLPKAIQYPDAGAGKESPGGAVIIPAHNESAVIRRTLASLEPILRDGTVEVIVACNACTDDTEDIAASVPGVQVITVPEASKVAALNAGDRVATRWPRIYLDADIDLPVEALERTLHVLSTKGGPLAARPAFRYDTDGASWPVRSFYRARSRIPSASSALWGAGIYGLSERGHNRFAQFPPLIGDDYYIDRLYADSEKRVLPCEPVQVRTPRTSAALLGTLRRVYRGNAEQDGMAGSPTAVSTLLSLLRSVRGPVSAVDAIVYTYFASAGRRRQRSDWERWERDDSSRALNSGLPETGHESKAGGGSAR